MLSETREMLSFLAFLMGFFMAKLKEVRGLGLEDRIRREKDNREDLKPELRISCSNYCWCRHVQFSGSCD